MLVSYNISPLGKRKRKCLVLPVQVECDNASDIVDVLRFSKETMVIQQSNLVCLQATAEVNSNLEDTHTQCLSVFRSLLVRKNDLPSVIFRIICKRLISAH